MNQNKLFSHTRLQLATWYTVVMGFILSLCGFGLYEAILHAHLQTLDRELEAVAGTLHDSIENKLKQPGHLEQTEKQLLSEPQSKRHILGAIYQGNYYLRLLDHSGQIVTEAGFVPLGLPATSTETTWQNLKDADGNSFHQISLLLHTQDNVSWGYMQMGRSLKDLDDYLQTVKLILFFGLPIAMILVGGSSWWLAGLAMQPIYQSYSQIQQFTADAAHELRTPLAATQATVESALEMPRLDEIEARDILRTIERQNRRLIQLVADLLLLARLERQAVPMRLKLCCLNDVVGDLIEELEALARTNGVTLTADIRMPHPVEIVGDEDQLYRLVSNLMINAIQYTPAGGKVIVALDRRDRHGLIEVQDTGIGIAPSEQKLIFDRFYRVNSDRSRNSGGSGLGLAIAISIVQAYRGSLQVTSKLGKGSTFTIRLPLG
ncbi:two-component system sensor histidine kinase RppB [Argonema antarcticum]|uniref:two-component system sensor histidine kinase RppB n=1 Tax=Argonema antarcticum TaxID=2942763 RepID=UPI002013A316|nr:two-component system sensor histidine kinase RppB [Argonema antarcticum]MCL1473668.1 HAMP domain-containing histidine kinase [Argonema antarcticum A004/B2]